MAVDYVCTADKTHPRQTLVTPPAQPPLCCGRPMSPDAGQLGTAPVQPVVAAAADKPLPPAKAIAPKRASKARKAATPKN